MAVLSVVVRPTEPTDNHSFCRVPGLRVFPVGVGRMKDPTLGSVSAPNTSLGSGVILSSQFGSDDDPFAEYMWMENEEEFNRQVEEELWEEEFIERCFQEMLEEEEQWEWFIPSRDLPSPDPQDQISLMVLDADADFEVGINSSLNPNAKEFTPGIKKHVM
ncbi:putative polyadenylate-binding protein-interacting protein 2 isoform 2 [Scophthalmus maximus]|uniref:Polyadenylate-binding protein-interacting protein 2 n=1 Tax=Scophthalmus maximus TaxID=52904 RepID=A0A2U9C9L4_SCOMX|nr:putative polyadenylate-binding protein-interacting protein 2 isoform 2 [Scophthalmus maximus]